MSDNSPSQWAPGLADTFTYQIDVVATRRALEAEEKRAQKAEKAFKDMAASPWWKLTSAPRSIVAKRKNRKQKAAVRKEVGGGATSTLPPTQSVRMREDALVRRLQTVLVEFDVAPDSAPPPDLATQLLRMANLLTEHPKDKSLAWLTYIAFVARYPTSEDVLRFSTDVQVDGAPTAIAELLKLNSERAHSWSLNADLELLRSVVVEPSFAAGNQYHTGIQRVIREIVPRWAKGSDVVLMIWGRASGSFRPPTVAERWRIMEFKADEANAPGATEKPSPTHIAVPWRTTVITPEPTFPMERGEALACMADWSNNELACIYYDFIPYIYPESFRQETLGAKSAYIPVLRTSARVSAISRTIQRDVLGYAESFRNSGFPAPEVACHVLPIEALDLPADEYLANIPRVVGVPGLPVVLSVASIEPRKNHIMTMRAAERLWREGVSFQLVIIGWGAWRAEGAMAEFERLQQKGRPIRMIRRADEALLWTAYRKAAFSVYISLVEGYGLPAAESIAAGTPVVLSDVGSMAEIGEGGGALMVDPRDLDSVADAMRTLLTDEAALNELRESARNRPQSTWDDYATATWQWLVHGTP